MLAAGLVNKEIAAAWPFRITPCKFHVASILGKLGASTRTEVFLPEFPRSGHALGALLAQTVALKPLRAEFLLAQE